MELTTIRHRIAGHVCRLDGAEYAWATIEMYIKYFEQGRHNISTVCMKEDSDYSKALQNVKQSRQEEAKKVFDNFTVALSSITFLNDISNSLRGKAINNVVGMILR
jgi:hypothetical protein